MKQSVLVLGLGSVLLTVTTVVLWATGNQVAAAILGTAAFFVWLSLIVVTAVAVGAWWTRKAMADGANIALQAQTVNDQWDARKTAAFATLAKEMYRAGQAALPGGQNLALPMPSQRLDEWLPAATSFQQDAIDDAVFSESEE